MTLACVIAAAIIFIIGLFAVIVDRTTERDDAEGNAARLKRELDAAYEALNSVLDEHALCPAPVAPRLQLVDEIDDSWLELLVTRPNPFAGGA